MYFSSQLHPAFSAYFDENKLIQCSSSVTPDAMDLKFGTRDFVVGATQRAKTYNNRPSRDPGKGVKHNVQQLCRIKYKNLSVYKTV